MCVWGRNVELKKYTTVPIDVTDLQGKRKLSLCREGVWRKRRQILLHLNVNTGRVFGPSNMKLLHQNDINISFEQNFTDFSDYLNLHPMLSMDKST